MKITIVGYDKNDPTSCMFLDIEELTEQDRISERILSQKEYPKGSMKVKMAIDQRSFYEGILEHTVRKENDKASSS